MEKIGTPSIILSLNIALWLGLFDVEIINKRLIVGIHINLAPAIVVHFCMRIRVGVYTRVHKCGCLVLTRTETCAQAPTLIHTLSELSHTPTCTSTYIHLYMHKATHGPGCHTASCCCTPPTRSQCWHGLFDVRTVQLLQRVIVYTGVIILWVSRQTVRLLPFWRLCGVGHARLLWHRTIVCEAHGVVQRIWVQVAHLTISHVIRKCGTGGGLLHAIIALRVGVGWSDVSMLPPHIRVTGVLLLVCVYVLEIVSVSYQSAWYRA